MDNKPRVIKDFEKLDDIIQEQIKLSYPNGFSEYLVSYNDKEGQKRTALPFETDEKYYLVRMTVSEAVQIVDDDEDFDDDGMLKDEIKEEYEEKFSDVEYLNSDDSDNDDTDNDDSDDDYDDDDDR
jgi:hypothetical protein